MMVIVMVEQRRYSFWERSMLFQTVNNLIRRVATTRSRRRAPTHETWWMAAQCCVQCLSPSGGPHPAAATLEAPIRRAGSRIRRRRPYASVRCRRPWSVQW